MVYSKTFQDPSESNSATLKKEAARSSETPEQKDYTKQGHQ
jgi:hypothetical protein